MKRIYILMVQDFEGHDVAILASNDRDELWAKCKDKDWQKRTNISEEILAYAHIESLDWIEGESQQKGVKVDNFYMCYVEGRSRFIAPYNTLNMARTEAELLANLPENEGKKVYLLTSIEYCQKETSPVSWHRIEKPGL